MKFISLIGALSLRKSRNEEIRMTRITNFAIIGLFLWSIAACASPSANKGSVFKPNEVQASVFSSSVQGR